LRGSCERPQWWVGWWVERLAQQNYLIFQRCLAASVSVDHPSKMARTERVKPCNPSTNCSSTVRSVFALNGARVHALVLVS
jgi:hypothetical protein